MVISPTIGAVRGISRYSTHAYTDSIPSDELFELPTPTWNFVSFLRLTKMLSRLTTFTHCDRFGAAVAVGLYILVPGSAALLATFGFLFSIPCFYFAVAKPKYLSASRFVLLTYNLTCLYWYAFNARDVAVLSPDLF